jgi:hypothetical protein
MLLDVSTLNISIANNKYKNDKEHSQKNNKLNESLFLQNKRNVVKSNAYGKQQEKITASNYNSQPN